MSRIEDFFISASRSSGDFAFALVPVAPPCSSGVFWVGLVDGLTVFGVGLCACIRDLLCGNETSGSEAEEYSEAELSEIGMVSG